MGCVMLTVTLSWTNTEDRQSATASKRRPNNAWISEIKHLSACFVKARYLTEDSPAKKEGPIQNYHLGTVPERRGAPLHAENARGHVENGTPHPVWGLDYLGNFFPGRAA